MSNPSDLPSPLPSGVVPAVVDTLDPDLAAAYRAGVPSIVNAVAAGMTTSQQVVNEIIRLGGQATGLPPGVVALVNERQKEIDAQRQAEEEKLRRLAAATVGAGLMATNIPAEASMYYGGEGKTVPDGQQSMYGEFKDRAAWSAAVATEMNEISLRASQRAAVSKEEFDAKPQEAKLASATETVTDSRQVLKRLTEERLQLEAELAGSAYSDADRQSIETMKVAIGRMTKEGRVEAREMIDQMPAHLQDLATRTYVNATSGLDTLKGFNHGVNGRDKVVEKNPTAHGDLTEADRITAEQAGRLEQRARRAALECTSPSALDKDFAADVSRKSDAAMQQGAGSASTATLQVNAANLAAGATVDTQVAKAELQTARPDDYGAVEDSAPRKPSIAASNLGNGPDSKLAQLGALPEAANDPKAPAVEPERPRVASLSQGMGGSAG